MYYLVMSTPAPTKPSGMRGGQTQWWDWVNALSADGTAVQVYTRIGRGGVIIFNVDGPETLHKLVNQWNELVPATFEIVPLLPKEHQERIARSGTSPLDLD